MAWGEELGQEETEGTHLDLNKFLESKLCRTRGKRAKCETFRGVVGQDELRTYLAYSSRISSSSSPSSLPFLLCYLVSQSGCITCN